MDAVRNIIFTACLCAVISAMVQMISPERMKKELGLICSLVLIICIAAQIAGTKININKSFSIEDNSDYQELSEEYNQMILEQSESSIESGVSDALADEEIYPEKIIIVCTLDEYNYVKTDKAYVYLSKDDYEEKAEKVQVVLDELLPESETEVICSD